jgi:hypothetical protein
VSEDVAAGAGPVTLLVGMGFEDQWISCWILWVSMARAYLMRCSTLSSAR